MTQAVTGRSVVTKIHVRNQINVGVVVEKRHLDMFFPPKYFGLHCATSRKVAVSIPDAVMGIVNLLNPFKAYRSRDTPTV